MRERERIQVCLAIMITKWRWVYCRLITTSNAVTRLPLNIQLTVNVSYLWSYTFRENNYIPDISVDINSFCITFKLKNMLKHVSWCKTTCIVRFNLIMRLWMRFIKDNRRHIKLCLNVERNKKCIYFPWN